MVLHAITGVSTPACLLAASISVEAVTPPLVGWPYYKEPLPTLGGKQLEVKHLLDAARQDRVASAWYAVGPEFRLQHHCPRPKRTRCRPARNGDRRTATAADDRSEAEYWKPDAPLFSGQLTPGQLNRMK